LSEERPQHIIHQGLERCWRVGEAEGHDEEFVEIIMCSESYLGDVHRIHAHLMIPGAEVELGKESGAVQLVQELFHNWNWEFVLHCALVEGSVIHT